MLFNSLAFAIFLPVIFGFYWLLRENLKLQNLLLLVSSYFFYAFWDYRFLFLLMFSTLLDFYTGIKISEGVKPDARKFWLWVSITVNLGFLGLFKYYDFFAVSFAEVLSKVGLHLNVWAIALILPVGISFYTFHGLSYVIDIYNRKIQPDKNFVEYAVFVSFFPLLVAGPIERATHLLPQIKKPRVFEYSKAVDGLRQILWGLFKKMVIADNCARYVNAIFDYPTDYSGSTLLAGAVLFAFQIYCDFSGYSDIALGSARLLGIELLRNFAFPYFSRDIAEFWRRWHISLSSWFRDYVYIPLGGSAGSKWNKVRNTFIIFILSGFWHGANWTFVAWGFLNALFFLPLLLLNRNRTHLGVTAHGSLLPSRREASQIIITFSLTTLAWVFFRSANIGQALGIVGEIFSPSLITAPEVIRWPLFLGIAFLMSVEWLQRGKQHALQMDEGRIPRFARWGIYYSLIAVIFVLGGKQQEFIYFQF